MARLGVLLLAAAVSSAGAQQPNFSGDWVRTDTTGGRTVSNAGDAAFRRGDMGIGWGNSITISQRPDSLILEYDFFSSYDLQPRVRFAYAMNGAESKNGIMLSHSEEPQVGKLSWQGTSLVITTLHPLPKAAGAGRYEVRQTLSVDASGALRVETTRGPVMGGAGSTLQATYIRK